MIELPTAPRRIFPEHKLVVEKRYIPIEKYCKNPIPKLSPETINNLKIVPMEASSALWKLRRGDLKQFCEVHIETHLCPQITSLCREHGPRIAYAVTVLDNYIELYSECFDPELVMLTTLGDISKFLYYDTGYRSGARFKRVLIPRELLEIEIIEAVEKAIERKVSIDIKARTLRECFKALDRMSNDVSEIIVTLPCLNREFFEEIVPIIRKFAQQGITTIFLTRPPHEADTTCYEYIGKYLILYLETMANLSEAGVITCCSSINETSIIVNRSTVITTYESCYRPNVSVISISDSLYASNAALVHLRNCICFSHLVKEDRR